MTIDPNVLRRALLVFGVCLGGFAALGWELVWQLHASLAIGVSSYATAVVVAATMGGMALGTVFAGRWLQTRGASRPVLVYGILEALIGVCGLAVAAEFALVSRLDVSYFQTGHGGGSVVHLLLIALVLGPPAAAMGATVPMLGAVGRLLKAPLALLYGANTLGAAVGTLAMAFLVVPRTGIGLASVILAGANFCVAGLMAGLASGTGGVEPVPKADAQVSVRVDWLFTVFLTGFAIFALEIILFRAMRAAFLSTTFTFAVMLGAVLLALAFGANASRLLERREGLLGTVLAIGGLGVLIAVPLVERMDSFTLYYAYDPNLTNFFLVLGAVGPVIAILGIPFPHLLDRARTPMEWGLLHFASTTGAIAGALLSAFAILPAFGIVHGSWLVAVITVLAGLVLCRKEDRITLSAAALAALALAFFGQSGIGTTRIYGQRGALRASDHFEVLAHREAPDYSVSVVREDEDRALYIDGFSASSRQGGDVPYMEWMGRLPMLANRDPKDALVICFGRGETLHALVQEAPERVDVVDISSTVFEMADYFPNDRVIHDSRVNPIVMDGRAWLRRTGSEYDVITLEPMPPTFAGMNSLYSKEFYELAKERLRPGGTIAQWVPFHLLTPRHSAAIAATFQAVFPDSVMWIEGENGTGVLVGRKDDGTDMDWPGLGRERPGRTLGEQQIRDLTILDPAGLARYAEGAVIITDDNQYLAYSPETLRHDIAMEKGQEYAAQAHAEMNAAKGAR